MRSPLLLSLGGACYFFGSCANPINARTAARYDEAGLKAENSGDLETSRKNHSRARWNAQAGHLGPAAEARSLYEFARVTGYAGNHAESETAFLKVLALIDQARGKADDLRAPALAEYSRLLHDTGKHRQALPVFAGAVEELEKVEIEQSDPIGFANYLDDYRDSLSKAGNARLAAEITKRADSIRTRHPGESAKFTARRYKA